MLICGKSDAQVYKETKGPAATMYSSEPHNLEDYSGAEIKCEVR